MSLPTVDPRDEASGVAADQPARLTIFAIPKPFRGPIATIQRNALASWTRLGPNVQILLFGQEEGVAAAAAEFGVEHWPEIARNEHGTPLVSDAFAQAECRSRAPYLAYCNADLILLQDFLLTIERLTSAQPKAFLAIGRRINLEVTRPIDFTSNSELQQLLESAARGERESLMCKDYFIFPRGQFGSLPDFAVGRGNWDSWLVQSAKVRAIPVVDLSRCLRVIHQNHDHAHVPGGRAASYWHGPEARQNQLAAGGKFWIRGATADWELTPYALRRKPWSRLQLPFWFDLPQALRLAWRLARPSDPHRSQKPA